MPTSKPMKVWTGTEWVPIGPEVAQVTYSANSPNDPVAGSLWFDTTNNIIRVYTGSVWQFIPATSYSASAPINPTAGSLWVNSNSKELFIWTGSAWVSTGGGASKSNIMFLAGM